MLKVALSIILGFCSVQQVESKPSFYDSIPKGFVLCIVAHADDESLVAGAFLSELPRRGYEVVVVIVTHGSSSGLEGGEYNPKLATIRRLESQDACKVYRANGCITLDFPQFAHYLNQVGEDWRESGQEIFGKWRALGILDEIGALMNAFHPVCVITLDPDHGMYGHPEHMAVGLAVMEMAACREIPAYAAENRFASILPGNLDPGPVALEIPGRVPCGEKTCWEVGYEAIMAYPSQELPRLDLVPVEEQATFLRDLSPRKRRAVK